MAASPSPLPRCAICNWNRALFTMATAETHYKTHLGPVYSWMLGDLDAAFVRSTAEIEDLPPPAARGVAVDLGAGLGLHALPLAKRGFDVVAIDNCKVLLDDLNSRRGSLPIAIHNADLLDFRRFVTGQAQVIVCMGDTLTHLAAWCASSRPRIEAILTALFRRSTRPLFDAFRQFIEIHFFIDRDFHRIVFWRVRRGRLPLKLRRRGGHALIRQRRRQGRLHPILLLRDPALVAVEIPHALLAAGLQHIRDLTELTASNRSLGGGPRQESFAHRNPQL